MGISTSNRVGNETSFNSNSSNANVSKTKSDENIRDTFQSIMGLVNVSKNQSQSYSSSAGADKSKLTSSNSSSSKSKTASNSTSAYKKESQQYKADNKADATAGTQKKSDATSKRTDNTDNTVKSKEGTVKKTAADSSDGNSADLKDEYISDDTAAEASSGELLQAPIAGTDDNQAAAADSLLSNLGETDTALDADLLETVTQIIQNVAELLNVSVDDVEQSMAELDVGVGDLLDGENVKNLVLDIKDASNIDMLIDESLGQSIDEISEMVTELVDDVVQNNPELDMAAAEQLNTAQDKLLKGTDVSGIDNNQTVEASSQKPVQDEVTANDFDVKNEGIVDNAKKRTDSTVADTVIAEKKQVVSDNPNANNPESVKTQSSSDSAYKAFETTENAGVTASETNQTGNEASGFQNQNGQNESLDNGLINNLAQALTDAVSQSGDVADFDSDVEAADIVRQVVDEIKTNINDRVRSLEVRLNPENLGRVQITVTTKNGVMQARIIAENEAAKNAIEGSLSLLKETFNEQNLKVEAVEVTIANYDFFKEESEPGNNENKQKNNSSGGNKEAINDDIVREEVSDAEQLEQDMMQQSGNSVSYAV